MKKAAVIIPNYNGAGYLGPCLDSLMRQSEKSFSVIVVDNGSTDGSRELIREKYPWAELLCLEENTGFCGAVNRGIQAAEEPYVILLNNDTEAEPDFIRELLEGIGRHRRAFAGGAKMLQAHSPELLDDAGDFYSALGWAAAGARGSRKQSTAGKRRFFRPVRGRLSTAGRCFSAWGSLMKNILPIGGSGYLLSGQTARL